MNLTERFPVERLAWSLRRLHCPVTSDKLVLEVGSGGNPYPRSNVLLDAYENTIERDYAPLVTDRPLVFGVAERMPFRDKVFDFSIASQVLEHSTDPAAFLSELMRVSKAGYIETPDAFCERIVPYIFHRLELTERNGKLVIWKKPHWRPHGELVELFEQKLKDKKFLKYMEVHPSPFYMRFYWSDTISYEIKNPEVDVSWPIGRPDDQKSGRPTRRAVARNALVKATRWAFSQRQRNRTIDLLPLLRCVSCDADTLAQQGDTLICRACDRVFATKKGVPVMLPIDSFANTSEHATPQQPSPAAP
jgi:uncharacterized protein YbaR (Trm112 family)